MYGDEGDMELRNIPLEQIELDVRNPRTDAENGLLDELAASIRSHGLVQPPTVIAVKGGYRVLTGERRVRAARLAGLEAIPCLVCEDPGAVTAHRLRVVENLHREDLNPLDEAAALRLAWLLANAEALGVEVDDVLDNRTPVEALPEVEARLREQGFKPSAPAVSWDEVLDELGIGMTRERRKKLLRVLNLPQEVQQVLRETPISEAGLRAIGTLEEGAQRALAEAIREDPQLAPKARRIARVVRDQGYSLEEALAEARGELLLEGREEVEGENRETEANTGLVDAVIALMDSANAVSEAMERLRGHVQELPEPWSHYYRSTLQNLLEWVMEEQRDVL